MSAIAKHKPPQASIRSSTQLFGQLGEMFSKPNRAFSAQKVSAALNKSVRQLQNHVSLAELVTLRNVVRELASQVDRLVPINDSSALPAMADLDELKRAHIEDAVGKNALDAAARRGPMVMSTVLSH